MILPRWVRVRYQLRSLLVGMAVIAVALAIFRWPWTDSRLRWESHSELLHGTQGFSEEAICYRDRRWIAEHEFQRVDGSGSASQYFHTTTFRRGWTWQPLKHGPEEFSQPAELEAGENEARKVRVRRDWGDGDLRRLRYFADNGNVLRSECRLDGLLHGLSTRNERGWRAAGSYQRGFKHGVWQFDQEFPAALPAGSTRWLIGQQSFRQNELHGDWTWKSASGRVLQSARFESGRIVDWQGQPLAIAIKKLLDELDPELRELLLQPSNQVELRGQSNADSFALAVGQLKDQNVRVLLHVPKSGIYGWFYDFDLMSLPRDPQRPVVEVLLELCLVRSRTLEVRCGVLSMPYIHDLENPRRDWTADRVQFAAGSPQQIAWDEPIAEEVYYAISPRNWLQRLFAGTRIEIDVSAFDQTENPPPSSDTRYSFRDGNLVVRRSMLEAPRMLSSQKRSRRDFLALLLMSHGWTCEQQGNRLLFAPAGTTR